MMTIDTREDAMDATEAYGIRCMWVQEIAGKPDTWVLHLDPDIEWSLQLAINFVYLREYFMTNNKHNRIYRWQNYIDPEVNNN